MHAHSNTHRHADRQRETHTHTHTHTHMDLTVIHTKMRTHALSLKRAHVLTHFWKTDAVVKIRDRQIFLNHEEKVIISHWFYSKTLFYSSAFFVTDCQRLFLSQSWFLLYYTEKLSIGLHGLRQNWSIRSTAELVYTVCCTAEYVVRRNPPTLWKLKHQTWKHIIPTSIPC